MGHDVAMVRRSALRGGITTLVVGALCTGALPVGASSTIVASSSAGTTQPLPVGEVQAGETSRDAPAAYVFSAAEAGRLTVALRAQGTVEVVISNAADGELPDGRRRIEVRGQMAVDVYAVGEYAVTVAPVWPDTVAYFVGASFLPWSHAAAAPDADGGPDRAVAIAAGEAVTDDVVVPDDRVDWVTIDSPTDGVLMVDVEPLGEQTAVLSLDVYRSADLFAPVAVGRFAWDQGVWTTGPLWVDVVAGETLAARLGSPVGGPTGYRLVTGLYPDADGRPESAVALAPGQTVEDAEVAAGDLHDWYLVVPDAAGRLSVDVEPLDGADPALDLQLLLYALGPDDELPDLSPWGATVSANANIDGVAARESGTIDVAAGQRVLVRIDTRSVPLPAGQYRLTTSWEAS